MGREWIGFCVCAMFTAVDRLCVKDSNKFGCGLGMRVAHMRSIAGFWRWFLGREMCRGTELKAWGNPDLES
jgi:hypothetical protein